jgi:hypothetical protein
MRFVQSTYNSNENIICAHPHCKKTHLLSPPVIIYSGLLKKSVLLLSQLAVKHSQYFCDVFLSGFFVFVFSPLCCMHALSCLSQLLNCTAILMATYSQWCYKMCQVLPVWHTAVSWSCASDTVQRCEQQLRNCCSKAFPTKYLKFDTSMGR